MAICEDVTLALGAGASGNTMITGANIAHNSTDNCADNLIYRAWPHTFDCSDAGIPYLITVEVRDENFNRDTCDATVEFADLTAPDVICPADITIGTDPGVCTAITTWADVTVPDNCTGSTIISSHNSGDNFSGTTLVTVNAVDDGGNTSSCSFNVIVVDDEPPTTDNCPDDLVTCAAIHAFHPPTFEDNCNVASITKNVESGQAFTLLVNTITYTATDDAGNTFDCEFTITRYPLPTADAGADTTISSGDTISLGGATVGAGGTPPYSYIWLPAASLVNSTVEHPSAFPSATTNFLVIVIDSSPAGCAATDNVVVTVNPPTVGREHTSKDEVARPDSHLAMDVSLFPNPADEFVAVNLDMQSKSEEKVLIEVYDILGRKVYEQAETVINTWDTVINVKEFAVGTYKVSVQAGDKSVERKFVIAR